MKRLLIPAIAVFSIAFLFFGCSNEKAIEKTIGEFEDAVNANNDGDLKDTLSPDSKLYITQTFDVFLLYFDDLYPVSYPNLDISVDGDDGDATTIATYDDGGAPRPINVQFKMRKEKGFFSFLNPSWKVLEYWDDADGTFQFIWQKLQMKKLQQER
jgi:hypothetical protein